MNERDYFIYSQKITLGALDWHFAVKKYETKQYYIQTSLFNNNIILFQAKNPFNIQRQWCPLCVTYVFTYIFAVNVYFVFEHEIVTRFRG